MKISLKLFLYIIATQLILVACSNVPKHEEQETLFHLKGNIGKMEDSIIYLMDYVDGEYAIIDSAIVKNESFTFSGFVENPELKYLKLVSSDLVIPIFVENQTILINVSGSNKDNITVSGSKLHTKMEKFQNVLNGYNSRLDSLSNDYRNAKEKGREKELELIESKYDKVDSLKTIYIKNQVNDNADIYGLYLITRYLLPFSDLSDLHKLLRRFPNELNSSKYFIQIQDRIAILESTKIGSKAPSFSQESIDGKQVKLGDYRGKYVLVDFWASWCGPCRNENPNVVKAYNKYHNSGFEVLGVSLDDQRDNWQRAIDNDKLTWAHVSDLKGWRNEVAILYGVNSIPFSILVDPEGIIIGNNLRGENLQEKLEEIFNLESN